MAFTVPASQVTNIKRFLELPESKDEVFVTLISSAGPQFNVYDLGAAVASRSDLPKDLVTGIIGVLGSMYLTRDSQETPLETFVDQDVLVALRRADTFSKDKETANAQWARLRKFLLATLSLESTVGTAAKAGYVLTQHEHIFVSARILTDIRSIFHQNLSEKPESGLIVHMLRMTHRDNHGKTSDEYFALDSNDVRRLKALIDRALKKEETLKSLMKDSGMTILNPKDVF